MPLQGNCSDPDAAAALALDGDLATTLLPLKPRQCLLLVPDTFIMSNRGRAWIDNLYLRLQRRLVSQEFAFVSAGLNNDGDGYFKVDASDLFITNVTFHGEHRGSAQGVSLEADSSSVLVQGAALRTPPSRVSPPLQRLTVLLFA